MSTAAGTGDAISWSAEPTERASLLDTAPDRDDDERFVTDQAAARDKPCTRKPSIYWLTSVYLLYTLGYGGIWVPKLDLIYHMTCQSWCASHECKAIPISTSVLMPPEAYTCREPEIQSLATQFVLVCNLIGGTISMFTCPKVGELSDLYGRTTMLWISALGMLLNETFTILVAWFPTTFALPWLYLGYAFEALFGSSAAIMAVAQSYAADSTTASTRNTAFGFLHGCLYLGIAAGPLLAGVIIRATGSAITIFFLAIAGCLCFILFMAFLVPESLSPSQRRLAWESRSQRSAAGGCRPWYDRLKPRTILAALKILWPTGEGSSPSLRRNMVLLAMVDTCLEGITRSSFSIIVYYAKLKFNWDTSRKSLFVGMVNICRGAGLFLLLPLLTSYFRRPGSSLTQGHNQGCDNFDLTLIRFTVLFEALGFFGYAFAASPLVFVGSGVMTSLAGISLPVVQSSLTKHIPADQTGLLLGTTGLLYGFMRIVAPILLNAVYAATTASAPQTVFVCLGVVCSVMATFAMFVRPGIFMRDVRVRQRD